MRKFNINELLWFIILIGFSALLYYLLTTGNINIFIHPKMIKYIKGAFVGFIILSINQLSKIFTFRGRSKVKISYSLFILILILGFTTSTLALNSSIANMKEVNLGGALNSSTGKSENNQSQVKSELVYKSTVSVEDKYNNDLITFESDNYYRLLNYLNEDPKSYEGKNVVIEGFVFKDSNFKPNEFVVARLIMVCCAADAQVVGLLSDYEKTAELEKDQWVRVEGKITYIDNADKKYGEDPKVPLINVSKVEKIEQPSNPYIYP